MSASSENSLRFQLAQAITGALQTLLNTKHLYQSVEVQSDFFTRFVEQAESRLNVAPPFPGSSGGVPKSVLAAEAKVIAKTLVNKTVALPWQPMESESDPPSPVHGNVGASVKFDLPTVQTFCAKCDGRFPFNAGTNSNWGNLRGYEYTVSAFVPKPPTTPEEKLVSAFAGEFCKTQQLFLLPYQCQQCKGHPVTFLVHRAKLKLTLCGRDPVELLVVPSSIPKAQASYYSNAVIAHHAGQTLAGLFLLRTFIEQFWQSLSLAPKSVTRMTGDEMAESYNRTLPDELKSRFPLSDLYGRLSAAMHSASADAGLFESAILQIERHFDARRLYQLVAPTN